MCLLAAVEGGDGEVDVVRLGVVANGVTVGDEGPETHHAVCVRRHLKERERELTRDNNKYKVDTKTVAENNITTMFFDIDYITI